MERTGQLGLALDGHFGPPFTTTLGAMTNKRDVALWTGAIVGVPVLFIAWIAHTQRQVFGTAALRQHDLHGREDLEPWLGGVFVIEQYRAAESEKRSARLLRTMPEKLEWTRFTCSPSTANRGTEN